MDISNVVVAMKGWVICEKATERDLRLMESAERDLENVRYFIQSVTTKKDRQH